MTSHETAAHERGTVFALLDDCDSTPSRPSSRLYTGFRHEHVCTDVAQLDAVCEAASADVDGGLFAVVLADYEFGQAMHQKTQRAAGTLRFLLFDSCRKMSRDEVDTWLALHDSAAVEPSVAGIGGVEASVDEREFTQAIGAIHDALRAGDSYQINYTYRLVFDVFGTPAALFRRLRARQSVHYGALIALPDGRWVVSCSPELFVEKKGASLRTRPMKGTMPRSADTAQDRAAADFLAHDPKNRAENVMIVDLLRNDLSRIAETGTVKTPALFSIEPYQSLWQMTSTVTATLRGRTTFADVLRALFPCGSITGAPKHKTMQLIEQLESTPRGLYTGAIGWLDAQPDLGEAVGRQCGDFCLSVAIRTLTLGAPTQAGRRRGEMGIGAGIVLDSVAQDEYAECKLKARFLTEADPGFQLFETMYATREDGVRHVDRHIARLGNSARWLGFRFDEEAVRAKLAAQCAALRADTPHRMRLTLDKTGAVEITSALLVPLTEEVVGVLLGPDHGFATTQAADPLLLHKTTRRAEYDRGWREAETHDAFDTLFFNEKGELTEGGRSNVFVKLEGRWWTPPLSSGLLPGVMRSVLLDDPAMQAGERALTRDDVSNAEALMLCNALRGALPARIIG
ncbi:aminodeoxychorismate synthase component I [Paraburkholderia diazotrophica]|uniref:Para-aminobenzoate synthetase / 4-amino-4-deoxychorismate lyase n=1 Tax=Paraburkholderia diazotrophica TaxID=667676 RepID=A0A1H7DDK1_9BURK|nr:aminodeoxychorismate synthase component I [Paraburkholderia diazotrophica]SEJ96315.1 para-aminobenzoate synthetase / 4-amino-4-deoxychorismate lyase [Paraburkholderia diazotrophica]